MSASFRSTLIFDFDGTIADTIKTGIEIYNLIAADYGLKAVTLHEAREWRNLNTRELLSHLGISRFVAMKIVMRIRRMLHEQIEEVVLFPGMKDAILTLNQEGFRTAILTSNSVENVRAVLQRCELLDYFSFIEAGVSIFGKSRRIQSVLKRLRIDPTQVMYVGDETRDIEAARDSRVSGIAVCWGANERETLEAERPDYCIDSPAELMTCAQDFADRLALRKE